MLHRLPDVPGTASCWEVELGCEEVTIEGYDVTIAAPERHLMRGVVLQVFPDRDERIYLVTWNNRAHAVHPVTDEGLLVDVEELGVAEQAEVLWAWGEALRLKRSDGEEDHP